MKAVIILCIFFLGVCAWCPWVNEQNSKEAIIRQFDTNFRDKKSIYAGACTLTKLEDMKKVWFGMDAKVEYDCEITGHGSGVVTYTFYNGVLGVPTQ